MEAEAVSWKRHLSCAQVNLTPVMSHSCQPKGAIEVCLYNVAVEVGGGAEIPAGNVRFLDCVPPEAPK